MAAYKTILVCAAVFQAALLTAQRDARHVVKYDAGALLYRGAGLAYAYRTGQKSAVEFQAFFGKYRDPGGEVFHGDRIVRYAEEKTDTFTGYFTDLAGSSGWTYLGDSRPLPAMPPYIDKSTLQFSLGFRTAFGKANGTLHFFIQPELTLARHRFFEIRDQKAVEKNIESAWTLGAYPYDFLVTHRTLAYRQTRMMRLKDKWIPGLAYSIGISKKLGKHLLLEGRLRAGFNPSGPYEAPRPPAPVSRFWFRPALMAGWAF